METFESSESSAATTPVPPLSPSPAVASAAGSGTDSPLPRLPRRSSSRRVRAGERAEGVDASALVPAHTLTATAVRAGYLNKRSAQGLVHNWRTRWVVLHDCLLYYYATAEAAQPQGVIFLPGSTVQLKEQAKLKHSPRCITVTTRADRVFYFATTLAPGGVGADDAADCEAWLAAIAAVPGVLRTAECLAIEQTGSAAASGLASPSMIAGGGAATPQALAASAPEESRLTGGSALLDDASDDLVEELSALGVSRDDARGVSSATPVAARARVTALLQQRRAAAESAAQRLGALLRGACAERSYCVSRSLLLSRFPAFLCAALLGDIEQQLQGARAAQSALEMEREVLMAQLTTSRAEAAEQVERTRVAGHALAAAALAASAAAAERATISASALSTASASLAAAVARAEAADAERAALLARVGAWQDERTALLARVGAWQDERTALLARAEIAEVALLGRDEAAEAGRASLLARVEAAEAGSAVSLSRAEAAEAGNVASLARADRAEATSAAALARAAAAEATRVTVRERIDALEADAWQCEAEAAASHAVASGGKSAATELAAARAAAVAAADEARAADKEADELSAANEELAQRVQRLAAENAGIRGELEELYAVVDAQKAALAASKARAEVLEAHEATRALAAASGADE